MKAGRSDFLHYKIPAVIVDDYETKGLFSLKEKIKHLKWIEG
jgi:hypothetical protein